MSPVHHMEKKQLKKKQKKPRKKEIRYQAPSLPSETPTWTFSDTFCSTLQSCLQKRRFGQEISVLSKPSQTSLPSNGERDSSWFGSPTAVLQTRK